MFGFAEAEYRLFYFVYWMFLEAVYSVFCFVDAEKLVFVFLKVFLEAE